MQILYVFIASTVTAFCTGLGVVPFFISQQIDKSSLGIGNALAAGLMMGASLGLAFEACNISNLRTAVGLTLGFSIVYVARSFVSQKNQHGMANAETVESKDLKQMLLVMVVMTVHSFAEGIGVGVSYGGREGFGEVITLAIAVHNIPEGLAIGLVMIPRGVSVTKAGLWSVFSSLPQPLMAVPAFLFVSVFTPLLPIGLGLAAGAMFYMVLFELLPEAIGNTSHGKVAVFFVLGTIGILSFQMYAI